MAGYTHLVSLTNPARQSQSEWEFELIDRLKKDASDFQKRPIKNISNTKVT